MSPSRPSAPTLSRTFAVLSLLVIAVITTAQVMVQWRLLREDLLEWERTSTAAAIRSEAVAALHAEDFAEWRTPQAQRRFEDFFRRALSNPEILRVKIYAADMRVVWSDEPRLLGVQFPENAELREALGGRTLASLESTIKPENRFERGFATTVELYIPLSFSKGPTPGTASIGGVVEIYKDPARMFVNVFRDRLAIIATSVAGALLLYASLFWIVHRASRQLVAQRHDLERQTASLSAANTELRAAQAQLRAKERLAAVGEVSAAVAHGIRNPLANIRASAQVALDTVTDSGRVAGYLGTILAEVDRLGRWLRGVLDSVRPFEPRLAPVQVNGVIDDLLALLRPRIEAAGVALARRQDPTLPMVAADELLLQQAFLGVLENALEALGSHGTLHVDTALVERSGRHVVEVSVADDGPGIPADQLGRVFELFFTTKTRGTGLGLAITRRVMEQHGGDVTVESTPGAGTTMRLWLPVEPVAVEVAS
jgi:two-component system, NtrC family, sensor histidine kinase HydH